VLKLWRLSDGQLADMCTTPDKSSITAVTCLGPLLVRPIPHPCMPCFHEQCLSYKDTTHLSQLFIPNGLVPLLKCRHCIRAYRRPCRVYKFPQEASSCCVPPHSTPECPAHVLQVAIGTSSSSITLYDTASGRLLAVQRLMAGPGEVEHMAAWLPPEVLAAANLAPGGPLAPDGGGVLAGLRAAAAQPIPKGSVVTGRLAVWGRALGLMWFRGVFRVQKGS